MADPLDVNTLLSALRAEGCRVVEHRNWRTHNRNQKGPWGPVHGIMIHHTVSSGTDASVRLCYEGRSDLPGPLCHAVGAKDGRIFLVGHGRTNHAGRGDGNVLVAVAAERNRPLDRLADTDGNRYFYGIELINLGDGKDPWPEVQVDAAARWAAAICRAHYWSAASVIGHKEWQPGKIDPTFDMNDFRSRVATLISSEGDVPTNQFWDFRIDDPLKDGDATVSMRHSWAGMVSRLHRVEKMTTEILAQGAARDALLERLISEGGIDFAEMKAAAEAGASAALDKLSDALRGDDHRAH